MLENKSNIYTQTGTNSQQIGTQNNNFNSYTKFRPIKWQKEIKIKQQKTSHQDKKVLKVGFIIGAIILSFLVCSNFTDIFFNGIFSFLIFTIFFYFSFHIFLLVPTLVSSNGTLKLEEEKMIFLFEKEKDKIELKFEEIRSIRKEKNFFGYSFYIYKNIDLYPSVSFYVESIDISLAIDELITFKIEESINKNEEEQKNKKN